MCKLFSGFKMVFFLTTLFLPIECIVSTKRMGKKKEKIKGKGKQKVDYYTCHTYHLKTSFWGLTFSMALNN